MSKKTLGAVLDTRRLLAWLDGPDYAIPHDAPRLATIAAVPGWRIIVAGPHLLTVTRPRVEGELQHTRNETIAILRDEWVPAARVALGRPAPAKRKEPPTSRTSGLTLSIAGILGSRAAVVGARLDGRAVADELARRALAEALDAGGYELRLVPVEVTR